MNPEIIEFVLANRPEVLPTACLNYDDNRKSFTLIPNGVIYSGYGQCITVAHAAALLEHWFIHQLQPLIQPVTLFQLSKGWHIRPENTITFYYADTLIDALWQAWKGIHAAD